MSFLAALLFLYEPVKRITNLHNIFQQAMGASEKVFAYLDQPEEIARKPGARKIDRFPRPHRVRGRQFPVSRRQRIAAGRRLARDPRRAKWWRWWDRAARGKRRWRAWCRVSATLISGAVRIDGIDVRDIALASLRDKISVVAQETFLFNDTVANNIAYGMERKSTARA